MTPAQQALQELHDQQQADLAGLTRSQRIDYAIARREMTHAEALAKILESTQKDQAQQI